MIRLCALAAILFGLDAQAATRGRGEVGSRVQKARISALLNTTCVSAEAGVVRCWGANEQGQVGNGTVTATQTSPATATDINGVVAVAARIAAISAGGSHTCGLLTTGAPHCWGDNSQGQIGDGTLLDRPRPTIVPSFTANVAPAVTLKSNGRIAEVTALLNCEPGSHGQIFVSLTRGQVTGYSGASTNCGYGLLEVPLMVPAHGPGGFQPGAATANLEAIVRDHGQIVEHLFWTRAVVLANP